MVTELSPPRVGGQYGVDPLVATSILVIEDTERERLPLASWLDDPTYDVTIVSSMPRALVHQRQTQIDLVIVDIGSVGRSESTSVKAVLDRFTESAVIVITNADDHQAAEAIRRGAQDCLVRSTLTADGLQRSIRHALARRQAEGGLRNVATELAIANAELCDFAHIVAHHLRAPIRGARLLGDRMLDRLDTDDVVVTDLGARLDQSLSKCDSIILAMLDYTALRSEFPAPGPVDLGRLLPAVLADVANRSDLPAIAVTTDVGSDLSVLGTVPLISKVVEHLIVNAIMFHPDPASARIELMAHQTGSRARIMVSDNGRGVAQEARERVFQPMERLEPDRPGAGFGLAICRRIVSGLDGSIWIDPKPRAGTSVIVELPLA